MSLSEDQRLRYERNLLAEGFSQEHMERIMAARITVVGAGGLGSAVLNYLVGVGVGSITIIEDDIISLSNLQRQVLYTTPEVGLKKVERAIGRLMELNPNCKLRGVDLRLTEDNVEELLEGSDVIVECTDNYPTRYIIDQYCRYHRIAMVYGTAQDTGGQVSVFNYGRGRSYCELYPEQPAQRSAVGVLSPVVGIIGSMQALETVKILCRMGETLDGRLLMLDGTNMNISIYDIT